MQPDDAGMHHSTRMRFAMEKEEIHFRESDKNYAAVCGLYCEACSWSISTTEDLERLKKLAG
jgi:hypothetical protein